jgi:hypothetical protein
MNILLLIAAIVVAWLVFNALLKILKVGLSTAVTIAIILIVLQFSFGINPMQLWNEIVNLPQNFSHLFGK